MRIALMAEDPSFGNCVGIYNALSLKNRVEAIFRYVGKPEKKMCDHLPHTINPEYMPNKNVDRYVIVAAECFIRLGTKHPNMLPWTGNDRVLVILTDSISRNRMDQIQNEVENYKVLTMADLAPYYNPIDIFYHPFEYYGKIRKSKDIMVSHSPFDDSKEKIKGTGFIEEAVKELGVNLDIIKGVTWEESIARKSHAHIFVDQIVPRDENKWHGGLGKSGIEAMATGCLTITSGKVEAEQSSIPAPPVVHATKNTLQDILQYYIDHEKEREERAQKQKQWVDKYLNYEYQSEFYERILNT